MTPVISLLALISVASLVSARLLRQLMDRTWLAENLRDLGWAAAGTLGILLLLQ